MVIEVSECTSPTSLFLLLVFVLKEPLLCALGETYQNTLCVIQFDLPITQMCSQNKRTHATFSALQAAIELVTDVQMDRCTDRQGDSKYCAICA